jgi:hypothetical protein
MAISGLDRRASKLEDSMDGIRRQKEADERKAWREANSERLKWEMFLRTTALSLLIGPMRVLRNILMKRRT